MLLHRNSDVQFVEEHLQSESLLTLLLKLHQRRKPALDQQCLLKVVGDDWHVSLWFKCKDARLGTELLEQARSLGLSKTHSVWLDCHHSWISPTVCLDLELLKSPKVSTNAGLGFLGSRRNPRAETKPFTLNTGLWGSFVSKY